MTASQGIAEVHTDANSRVLAGRLRRVTLTAADQALFSLTNFMVVVVAGRTLGARGLGVVAIGRAVSYASLAVVRSIGGEPVLIFGASKFAGASSASLAIALVIGAGLALASIFVTPDLRPTLRLTALTVPFVGIQDVSRHAFFASKRPGRAFMSDVCWALAQGLGLIVLVLSGNTSEAGVIGSWGLGALAGAAYGVVVLRPRLGVTVAMEWLRTSRQVSGWLTGQVLASHVGLHATVAAVGAIAGLEALGGLRASQTLLGPLAAATSVALAVLLPDIRGHIERPALGRVSKGVSESFLVSMGLAVSYALVLIILAGPFLGLVFGSSFRVFQPLILPVSLAAVAQSLALAPGVGSRAIGAGAALFTTQIAATAFGVPVVLAAAAARGAEGAAWGLVFQWGVLCAMSWATFLLAFRRTRRRVTWSR